MKGTRIAMLVSFVLAAAICFSASPAHAQGTRVTFKGKFTLPYEVRWGKSILPPGEYSMTVSAGSSLPDFVTLRSQDKTAIVLVGETSRCESCTGELVVVWSKGKRAIRAMELPGQRSVFHGARPDPVELATGKNSTERIRVSSGGSK